MQALERNVTISGGYLEELSVRYKKQIEDLQISVRQAHEAIAAAAVNREDDRKDLDELKADLRELSNRACG